jgi:hypothetical protein
MHLIGWIVMVTGLITKGELKKVRSERRRKMQEHGGRRGHHPKGGHRGAHADRPD